MDFVGNNNPTPLYETVRRTGTDLPDYCHRDVYSFEEVEKLANVAFADAQKRELPIHEKAAVWLSAAYYYSGNYGESNSNVDAKIKKAAQIFDIVNDVETIESAFKTETAKSATAVKQAFALNVDGQDYYPINSLGEVFGSSEAILTDLREVDRLDIKQAREACISLLKAANRLGVPKDELPSRVIELGRTGEPDFDHARTCARLRKSASADSRTELYEELIALAESDYAEKSSSGVLDEAIDAWLMLDNELGIKYSHHQPDPYVAFFAGVSEDEIDKAANAVVAIEDVLVPRILLEGLSDSVIDREFAGDTNIIMKQARDKTRTDGPRQAEKILKEAVSIDARKELLNLLLTQPA
jgi:hypothetical protein